MASKLASAVCALSLAFCGMAATVHTGSAQPQSVPAPALQGPPSPEHVQPWGLPPPPPGIGPVTLFADIHDQPQGKFLEGGAFDKAGNFWFVAIDSGWVSYLTPDAKLVPVFNCNPKEGNLGPACEPQGTRWHDGKLYLTTRHLGILVYDPETKKLSSLVSTFHNELFKGPNDLDFDAEGNLYFTDPWGTGPGPDAADQAGAVYQYSKDGILRRIISTGSFPNGIAVSPNDGTLAVADYASNPCCTTRSCEGRFQPAPSAAPIRRTRHSSSPQPGATIPATVDLTASTTTCMGISGRIAASAGS